MDRIKNVEALEFPMGATWIIDTKIANPMSLFPAYRETRSSWMNRMTTVIVKITLESGVYGLGWVGGGKSGPASFIKDAFLPMLVGESPFNTEGIWEKLFRASIPYGRKGAVIEAISGIDTALWDIKGKLTEQPVYNLLGGKTKETLPVYGTGNTFDRHRSRGIRDVKLAVPAGPGEGKEGVKENAELFRTAREAMGGPEAADLMIDCYMGWTKEYVLEMLPVLKEYSIKWVEEPIIPEHYDDYRRLRDILNPHGILVTGGEHEFTRFGYRDIIRKGAVDILQPDVGRAGGVTEVKRIIDLASVYNVPVIIHGSNSPTYHVSLSSVNCSRCEYLDMKSSDLEVYFLGEPEPEDGCIRVPEAPGFGYELNPALFEKGKHPFPIW